MQDFPDAPVVGQRVTHNNVAYEWDGEKWIPVGHTTGGEGDFLQIIGGTMAGPLVLYGPPTTPLEATTKDYVDGVAAVSINDAPNDGQMYGRQSSEWAVVTSSGAGIADAPSNGVTYGRVNATWQGVLPIVGGVLTGPLTLDRDPTGPLHAATKGYVDAATGGPGSITEAPRDGQQYARQDEAWTVVLPMTAGDAPQTNMTYGRHNGTWVTALRTTGGTLTGGLSLGSTIVNSSVDLARHLDLYGGQWGFSVTGGTLNAVAGAQLSASFVSTGIVMPTTADITLGRDPTAAMHVASKRYVDQMLPLDGGVMTGFLTLNDDPNYPLHAATKGYVDAYFLRLNGGVMSGPITLTLPPTIPTHAVNKAYVDAADGAFLPLAGGTMTGALHGVNARFSNVVDVGDTLSVHSLSGNAYAGFFDPNGVRQGYCGYLGSGDVVALQNDFGTGIQLTKSAINLNGVAVSRDGVYFMGGTCDVSNGLIYSGGYGVCYTAFYGSWQSFGWDGVGVRAGVSGGNTGYMGLSNGLGAYTEVTNCFIVGEAGMAYWQYNGGQVHWPYTYGLTTETLKANALASKDALAILNQLQVKEIDFSTALAPALPVKALNGERRAPVDIGQPEPPEFQDPGIPVTEAKDVRHWDFALLPDDVAALMPDAATYDAVRPEPIIAMLVKAVQQLSARVAALEGASP